MEQRGREDFWIGRSVLVTGAYGFLAGHLTERLLAAGARVIGMYRDVPDESYLRLAGLESRVTLAPGDITSYEDCSRVINEHDCTVVYHIAAQAIVGAANRYIVAIVLLEGVLIGFISWLLSSVVGLALSKQLADAMFQIIFDRNATLDFTALGNLIWLGLVLLLSVLASVVPSYNASRLTVREVLAYE